MQQNAALRTIFKKRYDAKALPLHADARLDYLDETADKLNRRYLLNA